MNKITNLSEILAELNRAKNKHPNWPNNFINMGAIVCEESGELIRECLLFEDEKASNLDNIKKETIQTIVTCLRVLEYIENNYE